MASIKYTNNARTTLAADLNDSATSATVVNGNVFPALGAGEHFYCTFDDLTNTEIVKVTARSTHVLTIVRAQDNTSARAFSSGHKAELRITAVVLEEVAGVLTTPRAIAVAGDVTGTANFDGSANISITTTLATDAIVTANITNANVTVAKMAANSVDSDQYVDGSIDLVHMSINSIDSDQYVDGSIDLVHMSANSVDSDQYVDGSIDLIHMSANSVDSDQYVDGSIDTIHIADDAVTGAKLANNIDIAGTLDVTGILTADSNVVVAGNLTVNGTTTTLNTATLDVEDKNITINYGAGDTSASANGAGITIQDAVDASNDATILWDTTNDEFDFSHAINVTGNIAVSGTVDGRDVASDGSKLDGIESGATADQTAAQILTAIKTVDGAGSGLDADLLDGLSSASFATSAQGTLAANALPKSGGAMTGAITTNSTFDGRDVATDGAKLDGIAAGATNTVTNATHTGEVTGSGALTIANDVVDAGNLKVTGNGTTTQFLRSDGDGTFTWATPPDTNTTYSVGAGGLTEQNFTTTLKNKLDGIAASANNYSFPYTVSASAGNSTVVQRHASGYIYANYFNTSPNDIASGSITKILAESGDDGFMRHATAAVTRTFLNVENGATADQTAAEILTAIKTVDGAGSGLDADLLDGVQGANYLRNNATNANATFTDITLDDQIISSGDTDTYTQFHAADQWRVVTGGGERLEANNSGVNVTGAIVASGNVTAFSDERLKDNIVVIDDALQKVSQLRGVTFDRTDVEEPLRQTGVIAQEVEKVLPEAVITAEDEMQTKSVAYGNMVGLLIEAIKELKTEVDDLKKQLDESK
jgi:hypothetical protein